MKLRKQIGFLFLALEIVCSVSGQELVSLTRDDLIPWTDRGIFMSVDLTNTVFAGESVKMNGVQLAYLYKHWLAAGLSYYSLPSSFSYNNHFYDVTCGGPVIHLMLRPKHLFFVSVGTSGGIGYLNEKSKGHAFFYVNPEIRIWVNVASFMRLSLNTAYRFANSPVTDIDTSGRTLGFSVIYGKF
jgi:hypothetical protein